MGGCLLLFWLLRIMRIFEHSLHTRLYCICIVHSWSNMVSGSENVDHYVYREHCIPLHAHIENRNRNVIIYTVPKIVMLIYMYTVPNIIWLLFPYIWHTNKIYNIYACVWSNSDRLGFYAEIQIIFGTVYLICKVRTIPDCSGNNCKKNIQLKFFERRERGLKRILKRQWKITRFLEHFSEWEVPSSLKQ